MTNKFIKVELKVDKHKPRGKTMLKQKKEAKVSLNIKINPELHEKLREIRARARQQGLIFNVSEETISFLEKRVKRAEKELEELEGVEKPESASDQVKSPVEKEFEDHPAISGKDYLDDIPSFTNKGEK